MSQQAYVASAQDAFAVVQMAIREAVELLPDEVRKQHWVAAKHSPSAWDSVKHWYHGQEQYDREIADVLAGLVMLSQASANLHAVITTAPPGSEGRLKLSRVRRSA